MATSPNFNWPEPDNTDLVKNGALAIRTAVDAIDTSLVDLKGGTTGQVLAKASGTDMDFSWVAQDDSNAIQNAIVDAKGDLIGATAADTPARLAVGTNGQVLTADSTAATGLAWATPTVTPTKSFNYIINGGMDISQRGTSFVPTSGIYMLDRWFGQRYGGTGGTVTQVNTSDTTNLPQITKAMRIANDAGTGTNNTNVFNSLENAQTQQLLGQTVTLSFYLRKGADYSGADFTVSLIGGTGTDQSLNSGYTSQATLATVTAVPSTTWTRYETSLTIGSTYTQLGLVMVSKAVGTSGANDWAEITGVQLELGSTATPFQRAGGTIQGELAACQRYYLKVAGDAANGGALGVGLATSTTVGLVMTSFPVPLRIAPTALEQTGTAANYSVRHGGGTTTCSAVPTVGNVSQFTATTSFTVASGLTAGSGAVLRQSGATVAYLAWSAEL
jgi:hypothetical protein